MVKENRNCDIGKYEAKELFNTLGLGQALNIKETDVPSQNIIFLIRTAEKKFIMKFDVPEAEAELPSDKGMLEAEERFLKLIAEKTDLHVPAVFVSGYAENLGGRFYFVRESFPVSFVTNPPATIKDRRKIIFEVGAAVAKLNALKGEKFGYEQCGLLSDYDSSYKQAIDILVAHAALTKIRVDALRINKIIERYTPLLHTVESTLVNFNIEKKNIYLNSRSTKFIGFVNWHKAFWGDFTGNLVSFSPLFNIEKNKYFIAGFKSVCPIEFDAKLRARIQLMRLYYGLMTYVRAPIRYKDYTAQLWMSRAFGKRIMNKAIKVLEKPIADE